MTDGGTGASAVRKLLMAAFELIAGAALVAFVLSYFVDRPAAPIFGAAVISICAAALVRSIAVKGRVSMQALRTTVLWICGLGAGALIGGVIGEMVGRTETITAACAAAGPLVFICVRLWRQPVPTFGAGSALRDPASPSARAHG